MTLASMATENSTLLVPQSNRRVSQDHRRGELEFPALGPRCDQWDVHVSQDGITETLVHRQLLGDVVPKEAVPIGPHSAGAIGGPFGHENHAGGLYSTDVRKLYA